MTRTIGICADELWVEGVVHYDEGGQCWVAMVDWGALRHASDEAAQAAGRSRSVRKTINPIKSGSHRLEWLLYAMASE